MPTKTGYAENSATNLAAGGTITLASLAVTGSDRAIKVTVVARPTLTDGQDTIDTVVFNGSESFGTEIAGDVDTASTGVRMKVFWLLNPTATTADVVVTTKNGSCHICAFAQALDDVEQVTPAVSTAKASSTTPEVTVSSMAGRLVLASIGHRGSDATFTADGDTTEIDRVQTSSGSAHIRAILTEIAGASSVSPSGVLSASKSWIAIALNVAPPPTSLTGVLATATAAGLVSEVPTLGALSITGVLSTATATGLVATLDPGTLSVTGQLATATAVGLLGDIPTGTILTGVLASAAAVGLVSQAPTLGALTVTGVLATATAVGFVSQTPTLGGVTVTGVLATASAVGLVGSLALVGALPGAASTLTLRHGATRRLILRGAERRLILRTPSL